MNEEQERELRAKFLEKQSPEFTSEELIVHITTLLNNEREEIAKEIEAEAERMSGSYYKMGLDRAHKIARSRITKSIT